NDASNNISNIKSGKNMYSLLSQEEDSITKEFWNDMVSQGESQLLSNMSTQEIDNGQNNNKEHMSEISPESSGSSQHGTSSSGNPMVSEDICKLTVQVIKDQVPTIKNQESPPEKVMVNVVDITKQSTSSNASNSPNIEQDLHNELTMNNPFSRQNPDQIISTKSKNTVMETIENEAEFIIVVNKKKK
ncbi:22767_t:CDS:2, partial [Gigaspora rosea]